MPKPDARCKACGLPMYDVGFSDHPSCADTPEGARIRAEHAARQLGIEGQTAAAVGSWDDYTLALSIVHRTAVKVQFLSANTIYDPKSEHHDPRWPHLGEKVPGAAFGLFARRHWLVKSGRTVPALSGKGHSIPVWESRLYVDEFKAGLVSGTRKQAS